MKKVGLWDMMAVWSVVFFNSSGGRVQYCILGRMEVLQAGLPLPIVAPRHRKLLATLLVHADDVVPSETLIDDLWGYEPPARAPAILHVRISELRNLLRGGGSEETVGILTRGSGYQLVLGPDDLDARSFELLSAAGHSALRQGDNVSASTRLAEALAIWRGPPLVDVADEQFAQAEIARLGRLHVQTVEDNVDVELALGRHAEVVAQLAALTDEHPLHERFWCQLMLAQYRAGRQGDALQTFSQARRVLLEHLGIEPGPELQHMHANILDQDQSLRPPAPFTPAQAPPNNLPRRLTSFVGRSAERSRMIKLLREKRLVTLVGTGGAGKSRLALEVAREALHLYDGGVWLVELAPVTDPERLVSAVAAAAGVREHPERSLVELLVDRFSSNPAILLFDNCEHLLDAAASTSQVLLEACPRLTILATSRERLGITGEVIELLPGLGVTNTGAPGGISPRSDAEQLFVDRAEATEPDLDLTAGNGAAVTQICRRLDGLPLAIELAAARVNALSVQEIASRLDDRFRLLDSGQRTAEARHQTLRAVVDWSYSLLNEAERRFFDAASVFVGGFTLDAAEFVCADPDGDARDIAGLLWRLVDKSLVAAENTSGSRRYRVLETLRSYGQERLAASDELDRVHERHSAFYLAFAEPAAAGLRGSQQPIWLDRLELEHGNLRASLSRSVEQGHAQRATRLAGAIYSLWDLHGHYSEGSAWLTDVLAMEGEVAPAVRARALMGLATLATIQGNFELGACACQEAAELYGGAQDPAGLAHAQQYLGLGCIFAEDLDTADALLQESLENARLSGDAWLEAWVFVFLGALALARGDPPRAVSTARMCESVARLAGDPECVAWAQLIGATGRQLDNPTVAVADMREALIAFQRLGAIWGLSLAVFMAALRASAYRRSRRALRLFSASERLRASIGATLMSFLANRMAPAVAGARADLGEALADEAWRDGAAMSLEAAAADALAELDAG